MDRKASINAVQKGMMVSYLKDHADLQSGRFTNTFTYKMAQNLWEALAEELNSVPNGAQKNWKAWRKTWQDIKKNVKSKKAAEKRYGEGTGGGEPLKILTDVEKDIVDILTPVVIDGINIPETKLQFTDDSVASTSKDEPLIVDFTSKVDEHIVIEVTEQPETQDHSYSKECATPTVTPGKKTNKTTRLNKSLAMSQDLLKSVNKRNDLLDRYHEQKIKYMVEKQAYFQEKLKLENEKVDILKDIANSLKSKFK